MPKYTAPPAIMGASFLNAHKRAFYAVHPKEKRPAVAEHSVVKALEGMHKTLKEMVRQQEGKANTRKQNEKRKEFIQALERVIGTGKKKVRKSKKMDTIVL